MFNFSEEDVFYESKMKLMEDYVPLIIHFSDETEFFHLYHFRFNYRNNELEFHFNKNNNKLNHLSIVNIDKSCLEKGDVKKSISEKMVLVCDNSKWKDSDKLDSGNYISDGEKIKIIYNDTSILFYKESEVLNAITFKKLSKEFAVSINEQGNIIAFIIFNLTPNQIEKIIG